MSLVSLLASSTTRRAACLVLLVGVLQFLAASGLSMALYPGGHPWNVRAEGYTFWRNTMSDLGKQSGNNGRPATIAATLFNVATALLAPAFIALWCLLPTLLQNQPRLQWTVRWAGLLSVGGIVAVALTPADRMPWLHTLAIAAAAVPGLTAAALACAGLFADRIRRLHHTPPAWFAWMTLAMLCLAMIHFGQYVRHFWLGGPWTRACPAVQKLAVLAALLWMTLTAILAWRRIPTDADV